jgi:hypothetical protein
LNKKELSQLKYLNREIAEQQRRLSELESLATSCVSHITGLPRCKGVCDKVGKYGDDIADLCALIDLNLQKCFRELNRLTRYINSVDDSLMRQILTLKYINNLPWLQIALSIGGNNTADSVRKAHDRFLEGN